MEKRWHVVAELLGEYGLTSYGVEVGVKEGLFSGHLLGRFPDLVMVGIDPYEIQPECGLSKDDGFESYKNWDFEGILKQLEENTGKFGERFTLMREYSLDAAEKFAPHSLDFVFIDAQHTYSCVRDDINAWIGKVKPGGLLCGHDYHPRLQRFADLILAVDRYAGEVGVADDGVWWKRVTEDI